MAIDPSQMGGAPPPMGAPGLPPGGPPGAPMDPMALAMALKAMKKPAPRHHSKAKGKKAK